MPVAEHLIAITRYGDRSLTEPQRAHWLFAHLRGAIPDAWSLVLMPDHVHMVASTGAWWRLRRVLTGFTRAFGVRLDVMPPEPAHTVAIAARQIRYGFGNPLRAGLVDDPWAWPWSTLRDLHGAAFPMWTDLPTTARRLRVAPGSVLRTLTAYADYAVPPLDDALPIVASLSAVRAAVHSALRADPRASLDRPLGRTLAIQTLLALGLPSGQALAAHAQCSTATVRRVRRVRHPALDAVLRCLADPRLAAPFPPPLAITSARRLGSPGHGR